MWEKMQEWAEELERKEKERLELWEELRGIVMIATHQPKHLISYIVAQDSSLRNLFKRHEQKPNAITTHHMGKSWVAKRGDMTAIGKTEMDAVQALFDMTNVKHIRR